ncbi:MAG: hypothetical protein COS90_07755 [Deltaproteobacteria bacterium CG07_land_8_20_14_0_80_60_11]|nr:MAG: hypothetical protein COS90_07755 [Deltaproteobacteria bacterium CG07_land_8_20_14_0_80_60_11]
MAACLEAKELNEMKARAEKMAEFVSALVKLPFHYFSFILTSYRLFIRIILYFKSVSLKRLTKCYRPGEQVCIDCLAKIYKFEQQMLNNSRECTNYKFIGWGFQRIVNTLEDRAETLILSTDEEAVKAINKFIDKVEKGGLGNANWQEQMNAL